METVIASESGQLRVRRRFLIHVCRITSRVRHPEDDNVKGYIGFDFPVIASQLGVVLDEEFKHVDLCPVCWQRGLWGGQKAIERSLGLKRKPLGRDGACADATWKQYETTGYDNFLNELLEYNHLRGWYVDREGVGGSVPDGNTGEWDGIKLTLWYWVDDQRKHLGNRCSIQLAR